MMDPANPQSFSHSIAQISTGQIYHFIDERPKNNEFATTLLCLHGFPDLWYGWRNQIRPWVEEGYRVVVPDMLGYGKTDMPLEASAYSTKRLCDDLVALLDHLGVQKAVVIGHDWGAFTAGRFALWYPQRVLALAMLSVPYTPPSKQHMSVHKMAERYPSYGYQVYFASDHSTSELEANLSPFFRLVFRKPEKYLSWARIHELQRLIVNGPRLDGCILNEKELEYYIATYQKGMTGPLSYYRTTKVRYDEEKDAALPSNLRDDLSVLCIYGTADATCPPVAIQNAKKFIKQLKVVPLPDVGHWVMLESPQVVTEEILKWLGATNLRTGATAHL